MESHAYSLILTAFLAAVTGGASACPNQEAFGDTLSEFSGKALYYGQRFVVQAGGSNSITDCGIRPETDTGQGYVQTVPDFTFRISHIDGYRLAISVISRCDSVLLINTATGDWFYDDDDNGDQDAKIVLTRPASGLLDVWVGTYGEDSCAATLSLETFRTEAGHLKEQKMQK